MEGKVETIPAEEKKETSLVLDLAPAVVGLDDSKSSQILTVFGGMAQKLKGYEEELEAVRAMDMGPDASKRARRLRLDIKKIRTSTENTRKEQKAEYLKFSKALDGAANVLKWGISGIEDELQQIEDHVKIQEEKRKNKLAEERREALLEYGMEDEHMAALDLGSMTDAVWNTFLAGTKSSYEQKKAAEAEEERQRLEREEKARILRERKDQLLPLSDYIDIKALTDDTTEEEFKSLLSTGTEKKAEADAEAERIRKENEELQKKAAAAERKRKREEKAREKEESERKAKEEAEKKAQEEKLAAERKAREKAEEEARKEREAREAEEAARKEEARRAAMAPDKEKLETIAGNLLAKLGMFSSKEAKIAMEDAAQVLKTAAEEMA